MFFRRQCDCKKILRAVKIFIGLAVSTTQLVDLKAGEQVITRQRWIGKLPKEITCVPSRSWENISTEHSGLRAHSPFTPGVSKVAKIEEGIPHSERLRRQEPAATKTRS
jgi:hypothetical protein